MRTVVPERSIHQGSERSEGPGGESLCQYPTKVDHVTGVGEGAESSVKICALTETAKVSSRTQ